MIKTNLFLILKSKFTIINIHPCIYDTNHSFYICLNSSSCYTNGEVNDMKNILSKKGCIYTIVFLYLAIIIYWLITKNSIANTNGIMPYPQKISQSMNWIPFHIDSYMSASVFCRNAILKIIVFMPLAYILPSLFNRLKEYKSYIAVVLLLGFGIEFLQVFLLIGYFDITDVIYYSIGSTAAFLIVKYLLYK